MTPVAIDGVDGQGISIDGVQVEQALSAASETVAKGVYGATTLSAVDADLAVGNIKKDVIVFGKTGTYESTLAEDITGSGDGTQASEDAQGQSHPFNLDPAVEQILATTTDVYDASSMAVAVGSTQPGATGGGNFKSRLYMGGVMVAETANYANPNANKTLVATRALSGEQTCDYRVVNTGGVAKDIYIYGGLNFIASVVGVGSIKL